MAVRSRRLTGGNGPGVALFFAAAALLVGTPLSVTAQNRAHERDRNHGHRLAAADLGRLQAEIDLLAARATAIAASSADGDTAFDTAVRSTPGGPSNTTIALVDPVSGTARTQNGVIDVPADTIADLVEDARASAAVRVSGPVDVPRGAAHLLVAAPVHRPGTPSDLATRRAATVAVVVTVTPLRTLLRPPGQPPLWRGADVRIGPVGPAVTDPLLTGTVDLTGTIVAVRVAAPAVSGPLVGWGSMAITTVIAVIGYAALSRQHRRRRRAEGEADDRARQLEMIAGTSSSLQQSLDLADLLPTFCVTIADHFEVVHVSVQIVDDDGHGIEAFRSGDPTAPGVDRTFDLRRGWRTVGTFTIRSAAPIEDITGQSLQAMCDLLAVAVNNAQLFQREQQAAIRLRELDTLKNAFLGTVSHELRTSTTAVLGFGDLLTDHWDKLTEERRRELVSRIRRQAGSLRLLVDDLLDYARLEHEQLRVSPRWLALGEHVRQLVESIAPVVGDHEIVVNADDEVTAWADPVAVERIVANLLSNAGKYSPPGTTITVSVEAAGDRARLSVADQGPGIPAEERRRVFVRFYRLDTPETIRARGAGIGLSILHDFAERSGADITIDDAPGGGALVTVDFPTTSGDSTVDAVDDPTGARA